MAEDKHHIQGLEEYIRQGEPQKQERGRAWQTAIALQAVDRLHRNHHLSGTLLPQYVAERKHSATQS